MIKMIIWSSLAIIIIALLSFPILKYVKMYYRFRRTKPELQEKIEKSERIVTVFFQGHGAPRSQGAKYFGKDGITAKYRLLIPENDTITPRECKTSLQYAPQLLYNAYTYEELTDIKHILPSSNFPLNPIKIGCIIGNLFKSLFIGLPITPLYYPVIELDNIAGEEDIKQLNSAIYSCVHDYENDNNKNVVVFGCSRGASTVFSTVALLHKVIHKHIKLVILEAPFDTVPSAIEARFGRLSPIIEYILETFTSYKKIQQSPLDLSLKFPLDIPVAFIMAKNDKIVPMSLTENLIKSLRDRGHEKIHTLILKNSCHVDMPLGDTQDQIEYKRFVDTLYNKYIY